MEMSKDFSMFRRYAGRITERGITLDIEHVMNDISNWFPEMEEGGAPQVLFNTKTREVWVSTGDWHDTGVVQVIHKRLKKIPGVSKVDGESESWPDGYNYGKGASDWKKVYPKD
jgi:hypothetical protein